MRIARPPQGFDVTCSATVNALIDAEAERDPKFRAYWQDVIARLKFTAHREGQPEPRLGRGYRLLAIEAHVASGRPRLVLGYLALGDAVTIKLLRIS